jgi:short-chain Z-isoprenyl diphosphate synthase
VRKLIYRLYERSIARVIEPKSLPKHVGVILDGNRRWAERKGSTSTRDGHAAGAAKIREFLGWCDELGVQVVTLYLLSTDNLTGRKEGELTDLLDIIRLITKELADARLWSIKWVGDSQGLPSELVAALRDAEKKTKGLGNTHVNLAVGYGGRKEIADAMRSIVTKHAKKGASIESLADALTPEMIGKHMYTGNQPDPELVIRTSGEQRVSNFLIWQSAYSELYFEEALWPDFRRVDFLRAIRAFENRHRRFGS